VLPADGVPAGSVEHQRVASGYALVGVEGGPAVGRLAGQRVGQGGDGMDVDAHQRQAGGAHMVVVDPLARLTVKLLARLASVAVLARARGQVSAHQ